MIKENVVLATSDSGKQITVRQVQEFIKSKDTKSLADFIYNRLYGRYIKPFEYPSKKYVKRYKNGFTIMANSCLLIETYISFTVEKFRKTKNQSGACFGQFFTTEERFSSLSSGGRQKNGELSSQAEGGIPNDFYANVRCGILHNAETKNGWTISRDPQKPMFDEKTKELNAVKFSNRLKEVLAIYKKRLLKADFDKSDLWRHFINRLDDLIKNV